MAPTELIVREGESLRAALGMLDRGGPAIAAAVDKDGRYVGLVDAHSIEAAITAGNGPDRPVGTAVRPNGALPATAPAADVARALEKDGFVPLLDGDRRPVDFASPAGKKRIPVAEPSLKGNE